MSKKVRCSNCQTELVNRLGDMVCPECGTSADDVAPPEPEDKRKYRDVEALSAVQEKAFGKPSRFRR